MTSGTRHPSHINGFLVHHNGRIDQDYILTADGSLIHFSGVEREHMIRTKSVPPSVRAELLHEGREHWRRIFEKDDEARVRCGTLSIPRTAEDIEWAAEGYAEVEADILLVSSGAKEPPQAAPGRKFSFVDCCDLPNLPDPEDPDLTEEEREAAARAWKEWEIQQRPREVKAKETSAEPVKVDVPLRLTDWAVDKYTSGEPPQEKMLVSGRFPMGKPGIVAAMGDTGKGFLFLDLAFKTAIGSDDRLNRGSFGGLVEAEGPAVIIAAEDDANTIHSRIADLDPTGRRFKRPGQLIVVPLPNTGSMLRFVEITKAGALQVTDDFHRLADALDQLKPAFICMDPIQTFFPIDLNKPENGQFAATLLCQLATRTGAATYAAHHMRKTNEISNLSAAREAIRGTGALVDGLRVAYALWPAPEKEGRAACKAVKVDFAPNRVVYGGIVKANGKADRIMTVFIRNDFGLLVDRTFEVKGRGPQREESEDALITAIATAAISGRPFTKTGVNGVGQRRHELPEALQGMGRERLEGVAQKLLESGKVVTCLSRGTSVKWLDVPGGPFAEGVGTFEAGAGVRK